MSARTESPLPFRPSQERPCAPSRSARRIAVALGVAVATTSAPLAQGGIVDLAESDLRGGASVVVERADTFFQPQYFLGPDAFFADGTTVWSLFDRGSHIDGGVLALAQDAVTGAELWRNVFELPVSPGESTFSTSIEEAAIVLEQGYLLMTIRRDTTLGRQCLLVRVELDDGDESIVLSGEYGISGCDEPLQVSLGGDYYTWGQDVYDAATDAFLWRSTYPRFVLGQERLHALDYDLTSAGVFTFDLRTGDFHWSAPTIVLTTKSCYEHFTISPDDAVVVVASACNTAGSTGMQALDASNGDELWMRTGGAIRDDLVFSPQGTFLFSLDEHAFPFPGLEGDGDVEKIDVSSGASLGTLEEVALDAVSPDEGLLVWMEGSDLVAVDIGSGALAWRIVDHGSPTFTIGASTPVFAGNDRVVQGVYTPDYQTRMVGLDAGSGSVLWEYQPTIDSDAEGEYSEPVALQGGGVSVGAELFGRDRVRTFDADGQLLDEGLVECFPSPFFGDRLAGRFTNGDYLVTRSSAAEPDVCRLRSDGSTAWSFEPGIPAGYDSAVSMFGLSPDESLLLVGTALNPQGDYELRLLDADTGAVLWSRFFSPGVPGTSTAGEIWFSPDGTSVTGYFGHTPVGCGSPSGCGVEFFFVLDLATGADRLTLYLVSPGSVAGYDDRLRDAELSADGELFYLVYKRELLARRTLNGALRWSYPFGSSSPASPSGRGCRAGADGTVFLTLSFDDYERLFLLESDGTPRWQHTGSIEDFAVGEDRLITAGRESAGGAPNYSDLQLASIDIATGATVSKTLDAAPSDWLGAIELRAGGREVVLISNNTAGFLVYESTAVGLDAANLDELWRVALDGLYTGIASNDTGRVFLAGQTAVGEAALVGVDPPILGVTERPLSLAAGDTRHFFLDAGPDQAGKIYWLLGSITGTSPGVPLPGGDVLPLVADDYFAVTLQANGLILKDALGFLDSTGGGVARLEVPPIDDPYFVGLTMYHAFMAVEGAGVVTFVSPPNAFGIAE